EVRHHVSYKTSRAHVNRFFFRRFLLLFVLSYIRYTIIQNLFLLLLNWSYRFLYFWYLNTIHFNISPYRFYKSFSIRLNINWTTAHTLEVDEIVYLFNESTENKSNRICVLIIPINIKIIFSAANSRMDFFLYYVTIELFSASKSQALHPTYNRESVEQQIILTIKG